MSSSVWVQLYYKGKNELKGRPVEIEPILRNIDALVKQVVKEELKKELDHAGLTEISVFSPGTKPPFLQDKALNSWDQIPSNSSGQQPLIVVAPQQQADGSGEKKRRLEELLFYYRAAIETCTSKSSKLAKVKKLPDGSKPCFLCCASGTATDKIEASLILQKQDIYATGGKEALLTLDALKNWSAGHGWKRPFKIHDPMNLIWLCHTHNLAFDLHEFGLSLGGLDNTVVFYSCLEGYAQLVADANTRLADPAQPFFDMSYVSRRSIGMRLCKAQSAGYFVDHDSPDAWKAVVGLSAAASLKHESDSDDEDEQ